MVVPGFVTVRTSSSRLPDKCLLPFGENSNVLQHIVRRASWFGIRPIVCTSEESSDDVIEDIAQSEGVTCFRGANDNKVKRWLDAADSLGLRAFHTVDADDPFFDADDMKRSYAMLFDDDLLVVKPSERSSRGAATVGYSMRTAALKTMLSDLRTEQDTEMVEPLIARISKDRVAVLPDNPVFSLEPYRLTLDYEEDYAVLVALLQKVGAVAPRSAVEQAISDAPGLMAMNSSRAGEWASRQAELSSAITDEILGEEANDRRL